MRFTKRFHTDVQFVFSRVQHHWRALNDKGERVPLRCCRQKNRKTSKQYKAGCPKRVFRPANGKLQQDEYRVRVVCQGVAKELDLKRQGRRNALGSILGRRRCAYFASTAALLASVLRSNTNTQCNTEYLSLTPHTIRIALRKTVKHDCPPNNLSYCTTCHATNDRLFWRVYQ